MRICLGAEGDRPSQIWGFQVQGVTGEAGFGGNDRGQAVGQEVQMRPDKHPTWSSWTGQEGRFPPMASRMRRRSLVWGQQAQIFVYVFEASLPLPWSQSCLKCLALAALS